MEIECKDFQQDRFTQRFNEGDESLLKYYQDLSYDKESIDSVLGRPVHKHTEELAGIIQSEMSPYGLSRSQEDNIETRAACGHRRPAGGPFYESGVYHPQDRHPAGAGCGNKGRPRLRSSARILDSR